MKRRRFIQQSLLGAAVLPGLSNEIPRRKKYFSTAFITDIHIKKGETPELGMANALKHVNNLKEKPDFIINGGDSIMDALKADRESTAEQWNLFQHILQQNNSLPIKHCIGNHDIWGWQLSESVKGDPLYGKNWWLKESGNSSTYYSFIHQGWKFIVLDSVQENNGGYIALLDQPQLNWLRDELANSTNYHVCLVSHIPIMSFCSAMFFNDMLPNGDWKLSRALLHTDARVLKELFKKHANIKACLSGHIHLVDEVEYLGIRYYCNGAISGGWWKGAFQDFNPAYAVFRFYDNGKVERNMITY